MKARKVIKKLRKAQLLLSSVVEQHVGGKSAIRDLLAAAHDSVNRARALIGTDETSARIRKTSRRLSKRRLTEEGRKRLSLAAKRRWAVAKRKGMKTLSAQR